MNIWIRRGVAVTSFLLLFALAPAQDVPQQGQDDREQEQRLPNGKSQKDEILKAEYEQNLKDAAQLVELSEGLKRDLEKNERYVFSIPALKKTDEIEKLVKKIRARMRHDY